MRPGRSWLCAMLLPLLSLVASGCWDRREVESLGYVTAMAFDPVDEAASEKGWLPLGVSLQVASTDPTAQDSSQGTQGMGASTGTGIVVSGVGFSPTDAILNAQSKSARQLYVAHNRVVVISEELARGELRRILDFFDRSRQARRNADFVIAQGISAKDAISAFFPLAQRSGEGLYEMIQVNVEEWSAPAVTLHDFLVAVTLEGIDPFAGVVRPAPPSPPEGADPPAATASSPLRAEYAGIALFQGDRLVGFMDAVEQQGLMWAIRRVGPAPLVFSCPGQEGTIVLEVLRSRSDLKTHVRPELRGTIEITAEGRILDVGCDQGLERTPDSVEQIHALAREQMESEVRAAIARAQLLQSDPFGFGASLLRSDPRTWKEIESAWHSAVWPNLPVDVTVKLDIRRPGLVSGPFSVDRS